MDQIHVTLPDGSVKDFPKGVTPVEIARSISPRLADAALVAKVYATDGNGAHAKTGIFSNSVDPEADGASCSIFAALSNKTSNSASSPKKIPMPFTSSAIPGRIFLPPRLWSYTPK